MGVSEKTPFFRFHNQHIAAGFDPPHPLKCTRNLFLIHDVTNVWLGVINVQRLSGSAEWTDILYEIDNQNVLFHLLHNVIERNLKHFGQDTMKFSLGTQLMGRTVAAAIDTDVTAGKEKCFERFVM